METQKEEITHKVREIYRVSIQWNGIPIFNSLEAADRYYELHRRDINIDYEKPWKSHIISYNKGDSFFEETPADFEIPEGFESLGAVIAAEAWNQKFIAYFRSQGDVKKRIKQKGNCVKTSIVPVLDLENIENEQGE